MVVLTFKNVCFLKKNGFLKFATIFVLIWPTCCHVSAKKESFFFFFCSRNLNLSFFDVLCVK